VTARKAEPPLRYEELAVLRHLAQRGATRSPVAASSRELGSALGFLQQATDRYLISLAHRGLILRTLDARKQRLSLTPKGLDLLRKEFDLLRRIFEGPGRLALTGAVASGLGEGRYYLSQPGYVVQFTERLGYTPFPGTLNVRISPEDLLRTASLRDWKGIRIDGFSTSGRTFGGATCLVARMNGQPCHLITPDRSHYTDVIEFVAAVELRTALSLKDGTPVTLEIEES
jgi:riboflavin kinase, archaea type